MGSFDKSYYDILSKYQNIVKEGMNVQPVYYRKVGDTYTQIKDNMELARTNPNDIFVPTGDPNNPFKSYSEQQSNPAAAPSVSVTGEDGPETAVTTTGENRAQYPTVNTSQTGNQQFYNSVMNQAKKVGNNAQQTNSSPTTKPTTSSTSPIPATKATTTKIQPKPASKAVTTSVR